MVASIMDNKGLVQDWNDYAYKAIMVRLSLLGERNIKIWNNLMNELSKSKKEWKTFIFDKSKQM